MKPGLLVAFALVTGCGSPPPPDPVVPPEHEGVVVQTPADSLALRTVSGTEIWFVGGRPASDSAGRECLERALEIRDRAGRRGIPLLYTLEPPTPLDDTSVQARIYNKCEPGDRYRISLHTGRPTLHRTR